MFSQSAQQTLFVAFAFISQALLIFNFAAYKWKPDIQKKWGWTVYAFGWLALPLGLFFMASGEPRYTWLACGLFAAWAIFGYVVDILRPVSWRAPIRWQVLVRTCSCISLPSLLPGFHCGWAGRAMGWSISPQSTGSPP